MTRTKVTVKRFRQLTFVSAPGQRTENKNIMDRRNSSSTNKASCKENERQEKITLFTR